MKGTEGKGLFLIRRDFCVLRPSAPRVLELELFISKHKLQSRR